jgi:hypothetical protein
LVGRRGVAEQRLSSPGRMSSVWRGRGPVPVVGGEVAKGGMAEANRGGESAPRGRRVPEGRVPQRRPNAQRPSAARGERVPREAVECPKAECPRGD